MSRHRDVRNMDYSDDYDGYDDVYGHSIDDDYYISPSHRQFMYNRENSGQCRSGDSYPMEQDIQEEDEMEEELRLSEADKIKLESCLEHVKSVLAPLNMPRQEVVKIIIDNDFESEKIIDAILSTQSCKPLDRKEKDDAIKFSKLKTQDECPKINRCHSIILGQSPLQNNNNSINSLYKSNLMIGQPAARHNTSSLNLLRKQSSEDIEGADVVDGVQKTARSSHLSQLNTKSPGSNPSLSFLSKIKRDSSSLNKADSSTSFPLFNGEIGRIHESQFPNNLSQSETNNLTEGLFKKSVPVNRFLSRVKKPISVAQCRFTNSIPEKSAIEHCSNKTTDLSQCLSKQLNLKITDEENNGSVNKFSSSPRYGQLCFVSQSKSDIFPNIIKNVDVSRDLSRLKLTEVKSLPTFKQNIQNNELNIDLTAALKQSNFENIRLKTAPLGEKFDLSFLACDAETNKNEKEKLKCSLDISHILWEEITPCPMKRPSNFGKILCLKYRIAKPKFRKRKTIHFDSVIKRFDFAGPSPDDKVLEHLRQHF